MSLYGRDDETWERLATAGLDFLIERARIGDPTTYTELNATLVHRTGIPGFNFDREDERAAIGRLLGMIVERNYPTTGLMISALVRYLDANDAGPGFYALATQLGLLGRNPSKSAKMEFWVAQLRALHQYYSRSPNSLTS
ncbi:hypothetical protein FHX75_12661 [Micromonospora palomenae]|uniref:Uncharacterized protein n=1 Tax=Micromonospora palomenae TaxID=1461247 RepID=A0A561WEB0_9ACTN|nr:hypothetical protein FHX75_12661 [Micromonospora palomenae]